jgi:hypothetical protein
MKASESLFTLRASQRTGYKDIVYRGTFTIITIADEFWEQAKNDPLLYTVIVREVIKALDKQGIAHV